jgi:hypothetical protein
VRSSSLKLQVLKSINNFFNKKKHKDYFMTNFTTISNTAFNYKTAFIIGSAAYCGYAIYHNDFLAPVKLGLQVVNNSAIAVANSAKYLNEDFFDDVSTIINHTGEIYSASLANIENAASYVQTCTNELLDGGLDNIQQDVFSPMITNSLEYGVNALNQIAKVCNEVVDLYENTTKYHSGLLITAYCLRDAACKVTNNMKNAVDEFVSQHVVPQEASIENYYLAIAGEIASENYLSAV